MRSCLGIAVIAVIGCALLGCGQKGNLYLPNQKKKVPAPQTQPDTQPDMRTQPPGS